MCIVFVFSQYARKKQYTLTRRKNMHIRYVKFKASTLVFFAKFVRRFNRHVKGIMAHYNLKYAEGCGRQHKLDVMQKDGLSGAPCVLYFHGGGWSAFDKDVFRTSCKRFADCGALVFNCNFRLAPKYGIEDMLADARAAFSFIKVNAERFGGDPDKIIFAGDSSGAHILDMLLNTAIRNGEKEITDSVKGCAYFYGVYDLQTARCTGFKLMPPYLNALVPPNTPDYLVVLKKYSPIHLVNEKHPPTFISCGKVDVLTPSQSEEYIKVLTSHGVNVKSLIFPEENSFAAHRFITYADNPAAKESFNAFKEFIKII